MDELYEAYCIQRRLQDGASKMKQAFASSPASRAARESLSEVHRSYREYTEVGARRPARAPPAVAARSRARAALQGEVLPFARLGWSGGFPLF